MNTVCYSYEVLDRLCSKKTSSNQWP
uniref:Uncharacterized protein n=1 Tax=Anguilla anguilla TaxID=7936 RepID=A0A0E9PHV3_ANGAN